MKKSVPSRNLVRPLMAAVLAGALLAPAGVRAETLRSVLGSAYLNNPTLRAERARQRATDEGVSQAVSGWRPTITARGDYGVINSDATSKLTGTRADNRKPHGLNATVTQPIFRGFKTITGTRQAKSAVLAGREALVNVEQQTLLQAVAAFMDVVRDQAISALRRKNVRVLDEQLRASRARFKVGEITRTDVAQARARKGGAMSNLAQARANLAGSRATFEQIVGHMPGTLRRPRSIAAMLPKTLNEAFAIAKARNPLLLSATFNEEASKHAIDLAIGDLLPEVSLEAQYNRRYDVSSVFTRTVDTQITGRLTVPLYQSGSVQSRVRQARQTASQRRLQVLEAWRQVRAGVITAWENLRAARSRIAAAQIQVDANVLAFRGVVEEAKVGSRTTLDILDAEQELNDSRVNLVSLQRDRIVAEYQLLAAVGKLTARDLGLKVPLYDPAKNYDRVRGKFFGIGTGQAD